jgi:hypothetical protein
LANLATILANIRENIVSVPSATEGRLVSWVQAAQLELEAAHQWLGLETEHVVDTVAGTRKLDDAPSDWHEAIGTPWYLTGDGKAVQMEWIPSLKDAMKDYSLDTATSARSAPSALHEISDGIGGVLPDLNIYPLPDESNTTGVYSAAGEYEIHIPYRQRAGLLQTTGTTNNFFTDTPGFQLFLEDYASGKAMLFNRDSNNAQVSFVQAQGHLQREKRIDKRRRAQYLVFTPRRGVHASRRQRRAV